MKTVKYIAKRWIRYKDSKTAMYHGFYNADNYYIGYYYQNKYKGFWLDKKKI